MTTPDELVDTRSSKSCAGRLDSIAPFGLKKVLLTQNRPVLTLAVMPPKPLVASVAEYSVPEPLHVVLNVIVILATSGSNTLLPVLLSQLASSATPSIAEKSRKPLVISRRSRMEGRGLEVYPAIRPI